MGMRIRIYCTVYNVHNIQILSFYNILSPFVVPFLLRGFPPSPSILFFGLPVTYVQQLYNLSQNLDILSICLFYIITLVVYALKCMSSGRNILPCDRKYILLNILQSIGFDKNKGQHTHQVKNILFEIWVDIYFKYYYRQSRNWFE